MKPETLLQWFTNDLLPAVIKTGKFSERGENQTLDKCDFEAVENYVSSFASVACFAKLYLKTQSKTICRDILIKFQSQDPIFREKMRTVPQYSNEVTLYNQVYPSFVEFLKTCGQTPEFINKIIPKCYFASDGERDLEKAVLILEDLRREGFRLSDSATDLDLEHCLLSVEKLAGFHSLSFAMKLQGWKDFENFKHSFSEVWLEDIPICREQCQDFTGYVNKRGIDYLSATKQIPEEYLNKLKRKLDPIFELNRSISKGTEPLLVICHGDFNRNNILYRYVDGEVVDARLIDYQRVSYGPPSLDLGFLIYMNTTQKFREMYFDQIFDHYYSCLVRNVSEMLKQPEGSIMGRIPVNAFREDFEKTAIYHYNVVSFFLPLMMTPYDGDFEYDLKYKSYKEMALESYNRGGDVVSKRISEIIVDFYRRRFYM